MKSVSPILDEQSRHIGAVVNQLSFDQHFRTLSAETLSQALRIPFETQVRGGVLLESGAPGENYVRFVSGALMCGGRLGVEIFERTMLEVTEACDEHVGVELPVHARLTEAVYAVFHLLSKFPCVHIALEMFNRESDPERARVVAAFQRAARVNAVRAQAALNIMLATLLGGSHSGDGTGEAVGELMCSAVYHVCGLETPAANQPELTPVELFKVGPKKGTVLN